MVNLSVADYRILYRQKGEADMDIVNELIILYDYEPEDATRIVLEYEREDKVDDLYALIDAKKSTATIADV